MVLFKVGGEEWVMHATLADDKTEDYHLEFRGHCNATTDSSTCGRWLAQRDNHALELVPMNATEKRAIFYFKPVKTLNEESSVFYMQVCALSRPVGVLT